MSHHFDSPTAIADGRLNLCDVYVFAGTPGSTVLVLTTNPDAGRSSPQTWRPDAVYQFAIATSGGGVEQTLGLRLRFEEPDDAGRQPFEVLLAGAESLADAAGGTPIGGGLTGGECRLDLPGLPGGRCWVGLAADPFRADGAGLFAFLAAASAGRYEPTAFQGRNNIFEHRNVTAIVLEIPDDLLGASRCSVWATVTLHGHAPARQVSRMGQPMLRPLFFNVPGQETEDLNAGTPADDRDKYGALVVERAAVLAAAVGRADAGDHAHRVADAFLPDVLRYAPGQPVRFQPGTGNGRALTDDAFGSAILLATGSDIAGSTAPSPAITTFPYLQAPDDGDLPALAELFGLRPPGAIASGSAEDEAGPPYGHND